MYGYVPSKNISAQRAKLITLCVRGIPFCIKLCTGKIAQDIQHLRPYCKKNIRYLITIPLHWIPWNHIVIRSFAMVIARYINSTAI